MDTPPFPRLRLPALPPPPPWLLAELRNRVVLLLNHVLQQEPEAQQRLRRQAGKCITVRAPALLPPGWAAGEEGEALTLQVTSAGLLAEAAPGQAADLTLSLQADSATALAQRLLAGQRPPVAIAGDVQLAAEVAWLIDHVRWDVEEDLARLVGDAAAHTLAGWARALAEALRTHVLPRARTLAGRAAAWRGAAKQERAAGDGAAA